ncbi:sensor histidine kinase [Acetobacteraceae bacterium KSS8]|uniref:histidine kinase n=1 Tax=Endosaccharibacter trunci TaxID=2812733 RepID=A0ABT1W670_9PROT|nr:sensor histidine kinase [Acetobacteraceae bacterium KSS8]
MIILLAVVPVGVIGALMAYHTYVATVDASSSRADVVAQTLRAQFDQRISDARHMLHELVRQPQMQQPESCNALLAQTLNLQTAALRDIVLLDAAHRPICASGPLVPARAAGEPDMQPFPDGIGTDQRPMLRLSVPATFGGQPASLSADLSLGFTRSELADAQLWHPSSGGGETDAWLLMPRGQPVPICADCGWSSASHARTAVDRAKEGRSIQHNVVGDLDLLVVTQPNRAEDRALAVFLWRVVAIAALLIAGLVVVMVGASRLIVVPLRTVTRSVATWREAGAYVPVQSRATPTELRQLSRAFADATRSVAAHEERLRKAEIKQELLIKEIHHRVKNNLQIIASLLNLQANRIRQPEARAEFASARDRVRALATLHRHLYSEGELHTLNMKSFLEELCGQLFQAIGETEGRRIRLEIEAPEIVMSTDQAVPLALVVTEAVSNAIKYAFPGGRSGFVSVKLAETAPGVATLVIRDNGVGIPAGRAETETGIRDGLGIQLIRGFARQLGATLEVVEGGPDQDGRSGGTCYTLTVPLQPEADPAESEAAAG